MTSISNDSLENDNNRSIIYEHFQAPEYCSVNVSLSFIAKLKLLWIFLHRKGIHSGVLVKKRGELSPI
jgi:hypothetical protein